jgi:hypothetical protein
MTKNERTYRAHSSRFSMERPRWISAASRAAGGRMESMIGANKKNKSTRRMEAPGVRPRAQALSLQHPGFRGRFRLHQASNRR